MWQTEYIHCSLCNKYYQSVMNIYFNLTSVFGIDKLVLSQFFTTVRRDEFGILEKYIMCTIEIKRLAKRNNNCKE